MGFLRKPEELELCEGAAEAIKRINESGYLAIVVTNQPVIARGEVTIERLKEIHNKLETLLGLQGAYIDGLYYCPHHPEGSVPEYTGVCDCRKPKPGMLLQALADYDIDKEQSFLVGDSKRDVEAAEAAGVKGYLYTGGNLLDFVKNIVSER